MSLEWTRSADGVGGWQPEEGGSSSFVGAEIYTAIGSGMTFSGVGSSQIVPFDTTQFDTNAITDLPNNQLVIPAGKDGYWRYGFSIAVEAAGDEIVTLQAVLGVVGAAWNLIAAGHTIAGASNLGLNADAIDLFSAGDALSVTMAASRAVDVNAMSSAAPLRLFAQFLGAAT